MPNELVERGVAKERMAMFKNLESGSYVSMNHHLTDPKVRVDVSIDDDASECSIRSILSLSLFHFDPFSVRFGGMFRHVSH